jgi:flagellar motor switch protein FliN/FliY
MSDIEKLQDLGEESALGLAQTLTSLLGRDVSVKLSNVENAQTGAFASALTGSYVLATLKGSGGVDGMALLLAKEKDSSTIADLLIGQDGTSAPEKMTELHFSAFGEVIHQLAEIFTQAVKKPLGSKASFEVKGTEAFEAMGLGQRMSQLGETLSVFTFGLSIEGLFSSEFYFCVPEAMAVRLSTGKVKPAASAPAGNIQTGVPVTGAQTRAGGATLQQFENESSGSPNRSLAAGGNIGLLMDVPLKLTVELGRTTKLVKEILALAPGSVVELDKLAGEAVDILVNEKLIAKGEVVVIDENFGVRITEIINPEERLTAVQA